MKKRKILSLIISTIMVSTTFVGCSSKEEGGESSSGTKEPITLTMFNADGGEDIPFTDEVAEKIKELTGVTLEFSRPVGGDQQAIPLMIASGEYPDLIFAKGDINKLIDAGAVEDLTDKMENSKYLKKLYGDQMDRLKYSNADPSIYTVGTYAPRSEIWETSGIMQLQNEVLKDLGYPKIETLDDFEKTIKDYITKYPTIDGQDTIGLSLMASDWRWLITVGNPAGYMAGIPDDGQWYVDNETGESTYKFLRPEIKGYFQWLNKMYNEGLLDPESFTQTQDTYIAKLSSGRVLGLADANWNYQDAIKALKADGKENRTYAPLDVTTSSDIKSPVLKDYGYSGGWGIAISESCKDKDRAFEFLDWLASDEAQVLVNWGIEGVHYDVVDGKRVIPEEIQKRKDTDSNFKKETGIGYYGYPFPIRGVGEKDSTDNYYITTSEETVKALYTETEKETLKAYGADMWVDLFPQPEELGVSKHGKAYEYAIKSDSDLAIIQKKADDYTQMAITQAIVGKVSDFDSAWEKIQKDLKDMNIEQANKEMTEMVKDKMKLWGTDK